VLCADADEGNRWLKAAGQAGDGEMQAAETRPSRAMAFISRGVAVREICGAKAKYGSILR
jgi:hypothetical protein